MKNMLLFTEEYIVQCHNFTKNMTLFYYHKHLLLDCEAKDVAKWLDIMFNGHVQAFQKQLFIPFIEI